MTSSTLGQSVVLPCSTSSCFYLWPRCKPLQLAVSRCLLKTTPATTLQSKGPSPSWSLLTWYCLKCWLPRRRRRGKGEAAIPLLLGRLAQGYLSSNQKLIEIYTDVMVKHDTQRRILDNDKLVFPLYSRYNNIQCLKSTVVRLPGQQDDDVFHAKTSSM